ncbi:thioredoxin domain-containing protein [Candidatus Kaiserbacteria bacterium]|nr:thioredoxin domain-containing protein [Candidatus Kaiserbacteria bacterium]
MNTETKRDMSALYVPVSIIIAALIIGGGLYFGLAAKGASGTAAPDRQQPVANVDIKDVSIKGEPFIGKANAPVVMAFWSDFQCPFCKAFETGGIPQINIEPALPLLITEYVNTGKLKIVFKDYPFLGEDSTTAAEYGRAVWDLYPAQYFAWRTAMYKAQDDEGDQGFGDAASIDALIQKSLSQMDVAAIKAQIASKKNAYDAIIAANREEGTKMGINGTPGFVVGKALISGAEQFPKFKSVIDDLLK